jgi:hypothetical protein
MVICKKIVSAFLLLTTVSASATNWYVATYGSDSNSGSSMNPFKTIEKAVSVVQSGEIIYVRGGTYSLTSTISLTKSGSEGSYYSLYAIPGETPVLDFSAQALDGNNRGIRLAGSYWHIKGIHITGAGDNGMRIDGGSHNIIENCSFYRNRDSGLQIDNGASYNTIKNCDSYYNADPTDYGDADGFAPKLTVGSGNYFYGCRAWKNCDDGWDGYLRGADDVSTELENCWAFENGYLEDGTDAGANANGNGFKMGGSDDKALKHNFTLKNCLAFKNKAKGFDQNNNKGSMILYNCTGYNNIVADYRITQTLAAGKVLIVKNCVDLGKTPELGSFAVQEKNSWMPPFVTTPSDFAGIDEALAYGPRKSNGDLPDINYMHLVSGSDLIDAGVDVGLAYTGSLPDLGCFESGITGIDYHRLAAGVVVYPNPVRENGIIRFTISSAAKCEIALYDLSGRYIQTLAKKSLEAGEQNLPFSMDKSLRGLYLCRIRLNDSPAFTVRVVKDN